MAFAENLKLLKGRQFAVNPRYGYGWLLLEKGKGFTQLQVPEPFNVEMTDVLIGADQNVAVCKCDVTFGNCHCLWACFIPRTTLIMDASEAVVDCNIVLASEKFFLSPHAKYPDPDFIQVNAQFEVRGAGTFSII